MAKQSAGNTLLESVHVFVDANVLIHFKFLNDIDWLGELGAKRVRLIFAPVTFQELDNIKDGMTKPGRREVARRVIKVIGEPLEAAPLDTPVALPKRANTEIMYASNDDLSVHPDLRQEKQDDHLLAAVLNYRNAYPSETVVLLSDDFNCRQRAKRFGIPTRTLSASLKRPFPRTEEEEELRKLKAFEPQVAVEFGADGDELRLPYSERRARYDDLAESYEGQIRKVVGALAEDYKAARGEQVEYVYVYGAYGERRQRQLHHLKDEDLNNYNARDQKLVRAVKALELDVYLEWLKPDPKVGQSWNYDPTPASRNPYELWQTHVEQLRKLAGNREKDLYYAAQVLQHYALPIVLRHSGGTGLQEGQITVRLEEPLQFTTYEPVRSEDQGYSYQYPQSKWADRPDKPSATHRTPHVKGFGFGNLHPGTTIELDPLYIFVEEPANLRGNQTALNLTVEVSGLNMRVPFRKTVTCGFV